MELRSKQGDNKTDEIETCFTALYGALMLKLRGVEISKDTATALTQISRFIALLAHYYQLDQEDKLDEE